MSHRPRARRVLVVEDDYNSRALMASVLSCAGYEVLTAPNGALALELLREQPADAILLDLDLPVLGGSEFAHAYRRLPRPHAPIIVVSALSNAAAQAARIRANEYLLKPFDLEELLRLVDRFTT
ncbi:MAG: response regulator [Chloroflexi bacterium]|nr:response regulator [Chloroflexota bacterium]